MVMWMLRASTSSASYYDPTVGRWTQQDPIAGSLFNANGLNRYLFVGDDPINQVDPSGESCTGSQILILAAVLAAALITLVGAILLIPASALGSFAAFVAFISTQAGLGTVLTAVGAFVGAQLAALGLSSCV